MKLLRLLSFLLILLGACGQFNDSTSEEQLNKTDLEDGDETLKRSDVDNYIVQAIKDYYQINFGKGARLEETISDSLIELKYYNIPDNNEDYDGMLLSITISLKKNYDLFGALPILNGDINNDQIEDLVMSVHTEGGGSGGNIWSQDIFVFIYKNEKYKLVNVTSDADICGCNYYGNFRARKIENNFLIGRSSCYTENDARCCPSLHYDVKVSLSNSELTHVSKREIK